MIREEIERLLERGIRLGFKVPTNDQNYLGWILFDKQKQNLRILQFLDESVHPREYRRQKLRLSKPYFLMRIELRRDVHEAGDYETERDYRLKERFHFASLNDVAEQLRAWGYNLEEATDSRDLDAP